MMRLPSEQPMWWGEDALCLLLDNPAAVAPTLRAKLKSASWWDSLPIRTSFAAWALYLGKHIWSLWLSSTDNPVALATKRAAFKYNYRYRMEGWICPCGEEC